LSPLFQERFAWRKWFGSEEESVLSGGFAITHDSLAGACRKLYGEQRTLGLVFPINTIVIKHLYISLTLRANHWAEWHPERCRELTTPAIWFSPQTQPQILAPGSKAPSIVKSL